ncbi:MAG: glycosyltransferase family 4 protein, partial [Actinomycetota bacterium]|nr:glycosyltransferase family 4 protein [Actinomycetota bacterium]
MLAPISWRVPPRHYGPWEQFVSLLTEGLVARGVDVTLFATADSVTEARLVGTAPTGYSEDSGLDPKVWEGLHISAV